MKHQIPTEQINHHIIRCENKTLGIGYKSYILSLLSLIPSLFQYQSNQRTPLSLLLLVFLCHTFFCGDLSVLLESDASSYLLTKTSSIIFLPGNTFFFLCIIYWYAYLPGCIQLFRRSCDINRPSEIFN